MARTKGEIIYFAIDKLIGHQGYQEWQEYYEISDKELNTFLEAGAKAVDELKDQERDNIDNVCQSYCKQVERK